MSDSRVTIRKPLLYTLTQFKKIDPKVSRLRSIYRSSKQDLPVVPPGRNLPLGNTWYVQRHFYSYNWRVGDATGI